MVSIGFGSNKKVGGCPGLGVYPSVLSGLPACLPDGMGLTSLGDAG